MIQKIISFVSDHLEFVLVAGLVASIVFGVTQCDRKQYWKKQEQKQRNNIEALNDSVTTYKNKVGELVYQKQLYQTDIEQLETLNDSLYEEVQKEKDKVNQISIVTAAISEDTMRADSVERVTVGDRRWQFNWQASQFGEGWSRILQGHAFVRVDSFAIPYNFDLFITRNQLNTQIITGIKEENGRKKIFVKSPYPNIKFINIQGAILDEKVSKVQKSSRFGIGPNISFSVTPDGTFVPTVGFGVNFNVIKL